MQLAAGGQKSRVLAGAVVLQGAGGACGDGALQLGGFQLGSPEQPKSLAGVDGTTAVGGAGNRQAPVAAAIALGCAAADKRHGLERFEGAAHETQLLGIAGPQQHPAAAVTDHGMDPMLRFGDAIAQQPHLQGRNQGTAIGSRKAGGQGHGGAVRRSQEPAIPAQRAWQSPVPATSSRPATVRPRRRRESTGPIWWRATSWSCWSQGSGLGQTWPSYQPDSS